MTTETRSLYSQLPAIDRLLRDSSFLSLRDTYGHTRVVEHAVHPSGVGHRNAVLTG